MSTLRQLRGCGSRGRARATSSAVGRAFAGSAGFSLMEVLVAMGILALIAILVIAAFSAANYGRRVYDRNEVRFHEARVVLQRMTRDISSAFLSKHESPDKNTHT
ncbi:MAG: prepilin-type N-terminal cleavage/methylation domain-containing protein [Myxococcales bacterium]|nr:prepilin-type N-terminal cleavage/methylation domain-containing protein [Myxococcales bacterium]